MKLNIFIVILCCILCECAESDDGAGRKLSVELNPGCQRYLDPALCDGFTFVHILSEGSKDSLHYIWDFTGNPSFLIAKTNKNATFGIDWIGFMNENANTVNFSSPPDFIFSSVLNRVLLFNDPDDHADVNDASVNDVKVFNPHKFAWSRENLTQFEDGQVMLVMNSTTGTNGSFSLKVSLLGS